MRPVAFVLGFVGARVVAVSRPEGGFALPGGFVEPGESFAEAAARELYEETGLRVAQLERVYAERAGGRQTVAFLAHGLGGALRSSSEGVAALVSPSTLLRGPYGGFAAGVFAAIRRRRYNAGRVSR